MRTSFIQLIIDQVIRLDNHSNSPKLWKIIFSDYLLRFLIEMKHVNSVFGCEVPDLEVWEVWDQLLMAITLMKSNTL